MIIAILTFVLGVVTAGSLDQENTDRAWPEPPTIEQSVPSSVGGDPIPKWIAEANNGLTAERVGYAQLAEGDEGAAVKQLQMQLARLHLYRGEIDGKYGREVVSSVVAAHKLLSIDRTLTWQSSDWLSTRTISYDSVIDRHASETDRIEVDLSSQLLYVIRGSEVAAILHVSTGNGASYWSRNGGPEGGFVRATTPRGDFTVFKHISRWRHTYLGGLYKPWYFTPYYAVHGSRSVPTVPASHGCVRVPVWEADHLDDLLEIGLPIHIWDA